MIRWKYLAPRVVLLVLAVAAVWLALNPGLEYLLERIGRRLVSAKVQIGRLRTSLWQTRLQLENLQVADRKAPMRNLFEVDRLELAFDPNALLCGRYVVRRAEVRGLRLGTPREVSGALEPEEDWLLPQVDLQRLANQWFEQFSQLARQRIEDEVNQLESVRLIREMAQRWPAEYEGLKRRADVLKSKAENLRELCRSQPQDPAQAIDTYRRVLDELNRLYDEIAQLRGQMEHIGAQIQRDQQSLAEAEKRDLARIDRLLQTNPLSTDGLAELLLGEEMGPLARRIAGWIAWIEQQLPDKPPPVPDGGGQRGIDVLFGPALQQPQWLVESMRFDGQLNCGDQQLAFAAAVKGLSSDARLYGKPTVVQLSVRGRTTLAAVAELDRTGPAPVTRITINCPGLVQPERVLGKPGQLALTVSSGSAHLWASLEVHGEDVSGQLLVQQQPVELHLDLPAVSRNPQLAEHLGQAMRQFRCLQVACQLHGTLQRPRVELQSNLGPQLAAVMNRFLQQELEYRRTQLAAALQQQVDSQRAQFHQTVSQQQRAFLEQLEQGNLAARQLDQLIAQISARMPISQLPGQLLRQGLGGQLPLRF